jgi:hypothetical protein
VKVEYSSIEKKFMWFLETGCQDILVENGILSRHYKSFGSTRGRRVTKSMFPRLLTEILNDLELRKIFLTVFKASDLLVLNGEGIFYNTNLSVPRYRALDTFKFDHVEY